MPEDIYRRAEIPVVYQRPERPIKVTLIGNEALQPRYLAKSLQVRRRLDREVVKHGSMGLLRLEACVSIKDLGGVGTDRFEHAEPIGDRSRSGYHHE